MSKLSRAAVRPLRRRSRAAKTQDVAAEIALGPIKRWPGIPEPTVAPAALVRSVIPIKEAVESLLRQRGPQEDSAVLVSDLDAVVAFLDARYQQPAHNPNGMMRWRGPWVTGREYKKHDVTRDGDWTMVALRDTYDRPAPQAIGAPFYVYQGASPTGQITASLLQIGQRYTLATAGWLSGWRVYTVAGNYYRVFSVTDPDGANELAEVVSFEATLTGWQAFTFTPLAVASGTVFELWVAVQEPDPTPTVWTGNWNYTTPPNPGVPVAGVIIHANSVLSVLSISKTDSDAGDRGAELLALTVGDIITGPGDLRWSIQTIADRGGYVDFAVAPAQQATPDGVFNFSFETVTAAPITTVIDPDYFLSNPNVDGRYIIDGEAEVVTQDAYGIDIQFQEAYASPDWDLVAYSG